MRVRRLTIQRFRALKHLTFCPGPCTVILGPNNAGKSTVLEALDLLLHSGLGRQRPALEEIDYHMRDPDSGFEIEAVLGDLSRAFSAEVHHHLEGWRAASSELVAEPDGDGVEAVVRVRVRGTDEFEAIHEFAKPESNAARFHPRLRAQVRWVFDGRSRDPSRQLFFYQGGVLDRYFAEVDLGEALGTFREVIRTGTAALNSDAAIDGVLQKVSKELERVGLIRNEEAAAFELGSVSQRALLQTLRLTLPAVGNTNIPLSRQGRGTQRLALVSLLLRLSSDAAAAPLAAFEEPEEALEPLRQVQVASMIQEITEANGQVFLVTHSPDIVRAFGIDSFLLLHERTNGANAVHLAGQIPPAVRQAYERRLDGPVVRGLFCRIPVLVEGPSDRAVFEVFWRELARTEQVAHSFRIGLDIVNAEGVSNMPMLAAVLRAAGRTVVAWVDQDTDAARREVDRLKREGHCGALVLHDLAPDRQNLEGALAWGCDLSALSAGMGAVANDRGYAWEEQRTDLISRCDGVDPARRSAAGTTTSLDDFVACLDPDECRKVFARALGSKTASPFEQKGARQARILAETIIAHQGVPATFRNAFVHLNRWVVDGCRSGGEIAMGPGA